MENSSKEFKEMQFKMDGDQTEAICRVCRSEATPDKPLYHPCICTGSIKFVHKECLLQWLEYSRNENCEVCYHKFSFIPVYSPDMPEKLPIKYILSGLLRSLGNACRFLLHYTLVAIAWLGVVPLTACLICRCLFKGSLSSIFSPRLENLFSEDIFVDFSCGCCVVTCTLCTLRYLARVIKEILDCCRPTWLEQQQETAIHNMIDPPMEFANNFQPNTHQDSVVENDDDVDDINEGNNDAHGDVNKWNPIEWYHAVEELTWERLLGLDGSLVFLEHVCWVVYINTIFTVVFAFCPYHIGKFSVSRLGFKRLTIAQNIEGPLTTLFGYINIGIVLALLHGAAGIIGCHKIRKLLGLCYAVFEVSLTTVIEVVIFPLAFGLLLDICSMTLLGYTIDDIEEFFKIAPAMSTIIHWYFGMVYQFFFHSFISLLPEILRLGVLWFLLSTRSDSIQEMLQSSILEKIRQFIVQFVICGTPILFVVLVPVNIIETLAPSFFPYNVLSSKMPYSEFNGISYVALLLPIMLTRGHIRRRLKCFVRIWCIGVTCILDIHTYLLYYINIAKQQPDVGAAPVEGEAQDGFQAGASAAAHQVSPSGSQSYQRPRFLPIKNLYLIFFTCISLTLGGLVMITVPVFLGRKLMSMCLGNAEVLDTYTLFCGLYVYWIMQEICIFIWSYKSKDWNTISFKMKEWLTIWLKMLCAMSVLLGLIPILVGLLCDLILVVPLTVSLNQTPLMSIFQDWIIGVILTSFAAVINENDWEMQWIIDEVYLHGIRNINLRLIVFDIALPVIIILGLSLSVPYIIACSIIPMFSSTFEFQYLVLRRIYPAFLAICMTIVAIHFLVDLFFLLYQRIKDDKYLISKMLVNYEGRVNVATQTEENDVAP